MILISYFSNNFIIDSFWYPIVFKICNIIHVLGWNRSIWMAGFDRRIHLIMSVMNVNIKIINKKIRIFSKVTNLIKCFNAFWCNNESTYNWNFSNSILQITWTWWMQLSSLPHGFYLPLNSSKWTPTNIHIFAHIYQH